MDHSRGSSTRIGIIVLHVEQTVDCVCKPLTTSSETYHSSVSSSNHEVVRSRRLELGEVSALLFHVLLTYELDHLLQCVIELINVLYTADFFPRLRRVLIDLERFGHGSRGFVEGVVLRPSKLFLSRFLMPSFRFTFLLCSLRPLCLCMQLPLLLCAKRAFRYHTFSILLGAILHVHLLSFRI